MRRLLKIAFLLVVFGTVAAALTVGGLYVYGLPQHDWSVEPFSAPEAQGRVARGRVLVASTCARCHLNHTTGALTGRDITREQIGRGRVYASNITRDLNRGIGEWTDDELAHLLRKGVHPRTLEQVPPYMPHMPGLADEDLADLLAFLRSDDPWVVAQREPDRPSQPNLEVVLNAWFRWEPGPEQALTQLRPSDAEPIALGGYLATAVLQCHGCHSSSRDTVDWLRPSQTPGFFQGGAALSDVSSKPIHGSNLTPGDAGIGEWSYDDFRRAMVDGFDKDGKLIAWPMPRYTQLSALELSAIYAYLRTLPPHPNRPPANHEYKLIAEVVDPGRRAFYENGCQYCHPDTGPGLTTLEAVPVDFPTDAALAAYITDPGATFPATRMPAFGTISEETMPLLVGYIRRRVEHGARAPAPNGI